MKRKEILATLDEIETDQSGKRLAVIVLDDGQQLVLPIERLPDGCTEGAVVSISFELRPDSTRDRTQETQSRQQRIFGRSRSDGTNRTFDEGT